MKKLFIVFAMLALSLSAQAAAPQAKFKAGKVGSAVSKAGKALSFPVRHPLKSTKAITGAVAGGAFDTLEAAVDTFGLAVQALGGATQSVGQGLEVLPKPLYYIGDALDYGGGYLNLGGAYLAQ